MSAEARPDTTVDVFLGGRLEVEQPAKGFRAGLDAVLLAAAVGVDATQGVRVLDAGAGVGTAGLCVAVRSSMASVVLLEQARTLARLAAANVARNGLSDRVQVIEADLTGPAAALERAGIAPASFDVVIANPPYLDEERHRLPADDVAAGAFGMAAGSLEAWLRFMARAAAGGGRMVLIHRADALADVLAANGNRFGALHVLPIHPREGEPAHRIIVSGRKGSRAPLVIEPGLVLHGEGNGFRPQVQEILRDGAGLNAVGSRQ
jgi:tRNA1(Val) A37 N6-methylase TrmN6